MTTKIGTLGHNNRILLNWLDEDTGKRDTDYFDLDALCKLGYGKMRVADLVVLVRTVEL